MDLLDSIRNWPPEFVLALLMVLGLAIIGAIIAIVAVIAVQIRKGREAHAEAALKQSMVQQGMTADDIERMVESSRK